MNTKICKKCNIKLSNDNFYINRCKKDYGNGLHVYIYYSSYCKTCVAIMDKQPDRINGRKIASSKYNSNNRQLYRDISKKNRDSLSNRYIIDSLINMNIINPSTEIIEIKRLQLKLYRHGKTGRCNNITQ